MDDIDEILNGNIDIPGIVNSELALKNKNGNDSEAVKMSLYAIVALIRGKIDTDFLSIRCGVKRCQISFELNGCSTTLESIHKNSRPLGSSQVKAITTINDKVSNIQNRSENFDLSSKNAGVGIKFEDDHASEVGHQSSYEYDTEIADVFCIGSISRPIFEFRTRGLERNTCIEGIFKDDLMDIYIDKDVGEISVSVHIDKPDFVVDKIYVKDIELNPGKRKVIGALIRNHVWKKCISPFINGDKLQLKVAANE